MDGEVKRERYEEPEISVVSLGDGVEEIRSVEAMRGCGAMWDIECGCQENGENVNTWAEELKETMPDESDETREELKREYCPGALLQGDAPIAAFCDGDEPDDKECEKCWNSRDMRCRLV